MTDVAPILKKDGASVHLVNNDRTLFKEEKDVKQVVTL